MSGGIAAREMDRWTMMNEWLVDGVILKLVEQVPIIGRLFT